MRRVIVALGAVTLFLASALGAPAAEPSGTPDTDYGHGGKATLDVVGYEFPTAMAVLADGSVAVALMTSRELVLAKVTRAGERDPSFGRGGVVRPLPGKLAAAPALFATPDGGLLVAAWVGQEVGDVVVRVRLTLAKLRSDGSRDSSYGRRAGVAHAPREFARPLADNVIDAAMTSDGGVVVLAVNGASLGYFGYPSATGVVRFGPHGGLETGFGIAGFAPVEATAVVPGTYSVATDSRDRVVVATTDYALGAAMQTLRVLRLTPDGRTDTTFGIGGARPFTFGSDWNSITGLTIDRWDRVVVAGFGADGPVGVIAKAVLPGEPGFGFTPALARFTVRGKLDASFGDAGVVAVPTDRHRRMLIWSDAVTTDALGRPIFDAFGVRTDSDGNPIFNRTSGGLSLVRLTVNGSVDAAFDQPRLPMDSWVQLQTHRGRIFSAGYVTDRNEYRTVIAAFRS